LDRPDFFLLFIYYLLQLLSSYFQLIIKLANLFILLFYNHLQITDLIFIILQSTNFLIQMLLLLN
jgi:hypothetical protein